MCSSVCRTSTRVHGWMDHSINQYISFGYSFCLLESNPPLPPDLFFFLPPSLGSKERERKIKSSTLFYAPSFFSMVYMLSYSLSFYTSTIFHRCFPLLKHTHICLSVYLSICPCFYLCVYLSIYIDPALGSGGKRAFWRAKGPI